MKPPESPGTPRGLPPPRGWSSVSSELVVSRSISSSTHSSWHRGGQVCRVSKSLCQCIHLSGRSWHCQEGRAPITSRSTTQQTFTELLRECPPGLAERRLVLRSADLGPVLDSAINPWGDLRQLDPSLSEPQFVMCVRMVDYGSPWPLQLCCSRSLLVQSS